MDRERDWEKIAWEYHQIALAGLRQIQWQEFILELNRRWYLFLYDMASVGNEHMIDRIRKNRHAGYKLEERQECDNEVKHRR